MSEPVVSGHVLIVEDEFLVAIHVARVLEDLGFADVHCAGSLEAAERDLARRAPLFAVLDINVRAQLVFPFADQLRERGVPFLFSSGRTQPLPPEWAQHPFVPKPLDQKALVAIIQVICPAILQAAGGGRAKTLGEVLYAKSAPPPPEREWLRLLQSVAARDQLALHDLYQRSHHLAFALIMRITRSGEAAEGLAIEVFHDIWRQASEYDPENGSVLGWIMNLARARALEHSRFGGHGSAGERAPDRQGAVNLRTDAKTAQARLALRIAEESGRRPAPPPAGRWCEPEWEAVAPGIECKLLAADTDKHRVSMLVRLAPGASYPAHTHASAEELHLLDGELWIDDRKLAAGDYNYGAPGTADERVWSETGCTCVLITSTKDILH